ncbi:tumor-associated calcium signal transducer 2 [Opisthocomus hoazin]|uniref:tumor-associated calcium signal transducer 2 n=1 Tax=Opisthocomus hoazin TaxID=30419 RepID=UPI003F534D9A
MEHLFGVLLGLMLAVASSVQSNSTCATNKCAQGASGNCTCTLAGSNHKADCSMLTSECLLMKAEMIPLKEKHFWARPCALLDNDSIYNPDCEDSGVFKARQCDQTSICWGVNTPAVRRTEKGDKRPSCGEGVRTSWIYIEIKHKKRSSAFDVPDVANAPKHPSESQCKLHPKYIAAIQYDSPFIQICLNQNEKSQCHVDTADAASYFGEDTEDNSLFHSNSTLTASGDALDIEKLRIYYIAKKPPELRVRQMIAGGSGDTDCWLWRHVLVILSWLWAREYKKAEVKEMGETRAPSLQLP